MAFSWFRRKTVEEQGPSRPIIPPAEEPAAKGVAAPGPEEGPKFELPSAAAVNSALNPETNPMASPRDAFSLRYFVALHEAEASKSQYREAIALLEAKAKLEKRLSGLSERIHLLSAEAHDKQNEFDELRFEKHLEDLQEPEDLDFSEAMSDSLDSVESLPEKRAKLARSIAVLAQLEMSRANLHSELREVLSALAATLPTTTPAASEARVSELIRSREEAMEFVENNATSDGEQLTAEAGFDEEELMHAMGEDSLPLLQHSGDSVFTIEK